MKKIVFSAIALAGIVTLSACEGSYNSSTGYTSGPSQNYQWQPRQAPVEPTPAPSVAATPTPAAPVNNGYSSGASAPVRNVYTASPASIPSTPATPPSAGYSSSAVAPQSPAAAPTAAAVPATPAAPAAPAPAQPDASGYSSGNTSFPVNPDDQSNSTAVPTTNGYSSGQ